MVIGTTFVCNYFEKKLLLHWRIDFIITFYRHTWTILAQYEQIRSMHFSLIVSENILKYSINVYGNIFVRWLLLINSAVKSSFVWIEIEYPICIYLIDWNYSTVQSCNDFNSIASKRWKICRFALSVREYEQYILHSSRDPIIKIIIIMVI